jgi:outer membrane protein assembly factor BamB
VESRCTTISCRFFARAAVWALVLATTGVAAQRPLGVQVLPTDPLWIAALSSAPVSQPVVTAGMVVVALRTGSIIARNAETGADGWTTDNLAAEQPLAFDDERLYVAAGEAVRALHAKTGEIAWVAATGTLSAPPIARGGWIVAPVVGGKVVALRASDGQQVWNIAPGAVAQRPDIDGDTLILPIADGRIIAIALTDGRELWTQRLGTLPGAPLIIGDRVFVGTEDKYFYALDASDGEIEWRFSIGAAIRGRPSVDDDHVYVTSLDNVVRALDRGNGARRWWTGVPFRPTAGVIVLGTQVIVPGPVDTLAAYNAKDGRISGRINLGGRLGVPPLFYENNPYDPRAVAATGTLEGQWKLVALVPGLPPGPAVTPLTIVPGDSIVLPTEWR